jgi:6-phosphogluconolactonase
MSGQGTLIIGSYTDTMPHVVGRGTGISVLRLKDGTLSQLATFEGLRNPTYLALSADGRLLYAVEELDEGDGAGAAVLALDASAGTLSLLTRIPVMGDAPCHVSLANDESRLFVGNYGSGNFVAIPLGPDGLPGGEGADIRRSGSGPDPERQQGPHVHQVVPAPDGNHVLICDAGADEIARYRLEDTGVDPFADHVAKAPEGSLPRHLVFSADGAHAFVLHELANTIATYAYSSDGLAPLSVVSTLPEGFAGRSAAAAIRLHPSGRFLYASNRGHDSIAGYKIGGDGRLSPVGWYDTRGRTPRDFAIDPTGRILVAANQDSHSLAVFLIDQQTGALEPVGETHAIGSPVCVLFAK